MCPQSIPSFDGAPFIPPCFTKKDGADSFFKFIHGKTGVAITPEMQRALLDAAKSAECAMVSDEIRGAEDIVGDEGGASFPPEMQQEALDAVDQLGASVGLPTVSRRASSAAAVVQSDSVGLNLDQARAILKELVGNQTLDPDILNSLNEGCMDKVIEVGFSSVENDCSTEPPCHLTSTVIIASP